MRARCCAAWARRRRGSPRSTPASSCCSARPRARSERWRAMAPSRRSPPRPWPALQGFLVGLVLLLGFALPPLLQLKNVPAVRVIRRETGAPRRSALGAYVVGLGVLAGLLVWQA